MELYTEIEIDNIPCWAVQSNQREGGESWIFLTDLDTKTSKDKSPFKNETLGFESGELMEF